MVKCTRCGDQINAHMDMTTGYGKTRSGKILCYPCCGELDWFHMKRRGKYMLYLHTNKDGGLEVCNWPNSLNFKVKGSYKTLHYTPNVWYKQEKTHVWFDGPDGSHWYGYSIGAYTQICHVRRLKH